MYLKYVSDHPESPRAAEALYKAAWRMASAGDMWAADNNDNRAQADRARASDIGNQLQSKYPQSEYAARSASLIYKVQQGIAIYGSDRE
jgi:outer membrane protein assembly factor BamD (BamD/ComL family)